MERVAFLVEETNERIRCLLNPESLVVHRLAGLQTRQSMSGPLTGTGLTDDPLLYTGGGRTELELDLLFDVTLAGSSITTDDVQELTAPLWNLAENSASSRGYRQPPQVRFLWGKYWDIPGVIVAVSERLEQFTAAGAPRRSWLRLRLRRVNEPNVTSATGARPGSNTSLSLADLPENPVAEGGDVHEVRGSGSEEERGAGERLDQLADTYYGDPSLWRLIAQVNDIDDPTQVASGSVLQVPPLSALGNSS